MILFIIIVGDKMQEPYFNQCILCTVKSCKFHSHEDKCNLGKILVSSNNKGTNCASYIKK